MHTDVSDAYKTVINSDVRPVSQFEAEIVAFDTDAENGISYSCTGVTSSSATMGWPKEGESEDSVATFEPGRMIVGSNQAPATNEGGRGYILSSDLCDENGDFNTPPTLTVTFLSAIDIRGINFRFIEDYATEIRTTLYNGDSIVAEFTIEPDSLVYSAYGSQFEQCDAIHMEFRKLSRPLRRLRLSMFRIGIILFLNNENVSRATYSAEVDPISSTMSRYGLTIEVIDEKGLFNPDNPDGIWSVFDEKQKVTAKMGTTIGDNTEFVPLVPLYLSGPPVSSKLLATFEAIDVIQSYLNTPYVPEANTEGGVDIATILHEALSFSSALNQYYYVDPQLQNDPSYAKIEYTTTCRDALQMAANAGRATVSIKSDGNLPGLIEIRKQNNSIELSGYKLTYDNLLDKPELSLKKKIKEVVVSWYQYVPAEDSTVLYEGDFEFVTEASFFISYPCAKDITVTSSLNFDSRRYYNSALIRPLESGASHIVITGKKYTTEAYNITVPVNSEGESVNIDNRLITSPEMAKALGEWVADHYSLPQEYKGDMRQDYLLEANDTVELETDYGEVPVRLYSIEYSIPGQRGRYAGRRVNAVDPT